MNFFEKLTGAVLKNNSLLCVGLDPDPELMPDKVKVFDFNKAIIDATSDLVCAYKLNLAFYEALDDKGLDTLKRTIQHIPGDIPVIADAKRNDIGNTARAYAKAIFSNLNFDATTVNPYLGFDSLQPFIEYTDRGIFVLCRTSNPGSADFQSLRCRYGKGYHPLFEIVADKVSQWNTHHNLGLVVGATYPEELKSIRQSHPDIPILIPGIGAQGGDLSLAVRYGVDSQGRGIILNSSRQVLYASRDKDFRPAAWRSASMLRDEINQHLSALAS
jgi:orotidine-5'-phosphate decarboxylase